MARAPFSDSVNNPLVVWYPFVVIYVRYVHLIESWSIVAKRADLGLGVIGRMSKCNLGPDRKSREISFLLLSD